MKGFHEKLAADFMSPFRQAAHSYRAAKASPVYKAKLVAGTGLLGAGALGYGYKKLTGLDEPGRVEGPPPTFQGGPQ